MGSSHSKSSPEDVLPNIQWAATQVAHWKDTARLDKDVLLEEHLEEKHDDKKANDEKGKLKEKQYREAATHKYARTVAACKRFLAFSSQVLVVKCRTEIYAEKAKNAPGGPKARYAYEELKEKSAENLTQALTSWDHGKAAVEWLATDYATHTNAARAAMQLVAAVRELAALPANSKKLPQAKKVVEGAQEKLDACEMACKAHETAALDVGLKYLDKNNTGGVEPEDLPAMTAKMFVLMDRKKNAKITAPEMRVAVREQRMKIDKAETELNALTTELKEAKRALDTLRAGKPSAKEKVEAAEVEVIRAQKKVDAAQRMVEEEREVHRVAVDFFLDAFALNVLGKLAPEINDPHARVAKEAAAQDVTEISADADEDADAEDK